MEEQKEELKISVYNKTFWDLWLQKIFRNIASMKFQWLLLLYIPVVYGMFTFKDGKQIISTDLGLGFLGVGFVTLATSRIIAKTRLIEPKEDKEQ